MVKRPRIGVSGNAKPWSPSWWCTALALRLAGAIPARISVRHSQNIEFIDALIVGGGDDIDPKYYEGETNNKDKIDIKRDQLEIDWVKKALRKTIPLIGICRGAQLINVVSGGSLFQDIRSLRQRTDNRPGLLPTKQVQVSKGSLLARILNTRHLRVNSLHHQSIRMTGANLKVVGWDLDNITQALESKEDNIIGLQWHPEYLIYLPSQFAIFRWLIKCTKRGTF
jgi:putative glutamine amidotransferase